MDDYIFLAKPTVNNIKPLSIPWLQDQILGNSDPNAGLVRAYRPFHNIEQTICYSLFGSHYWQHHLFNLFLFTISALLIYIFIGRISNNCNLGLFTSVLYIVHPINGVVVNYITASIFAFQVIFILGAIMFLWESTKRQDNRVLYY